MCCVRKIESNKSLRHIVKLSALDFVCVCVTSFLTLNPVLSLQPVHAAFGTWSRRVRFQNSDPVVDSSLVIMSTEVSDEGRYLCRISSYPLGNFDMELSIIVWSEWKILLVELLSCDL